MTAIVAALLAVTAGAVVYASALGAKTHLGEQRRPVATLLAVVAGAVVLGLFLIFPLPNL